MLTRDHSGLQGFYPHATLRGRRKLRWMQLLEVYFDGSSCANMSPAGGGCHHYSLVGWCVCDSEPWQSAQRHMSRRTQPHNSVPVWSFVYPHLFDSVFGVVYAIESLLGWELCVNTCPCFPSLPIGSADLCNVLGHPYHLLLEKSSC